MSARNVAELREQGFTVLPGVYSAEYVTRARAELERIYEAAGRPYLSCDGCKEMGHPDWKLKATGLTVSKVINHAPTLADGFVAPEVTDVLVGALGEGARMEMTSAVVSDSVRQMHPWHHHIGGLDEGEPSAMERARQPAVGRLSLLIYLNALGPGTGQLLLWPRAVSDGLHRPFPDVRMEWEGQVALVCPVGSAALVDERTWHAVSPRQHDGLRMLIGGQFASAAMPSTRGSDDSVALFSPRAPWTKASPTAPLR